MEFENWMVGQSVSWLDPFGNGEKEFGTLLEPHDYFKDSAWVFWDNNKEKLYIELNELMFEDRGKLESCGEVTINGKRYKLVEI